MVEMRSHTSKIFFGVSLSLILFFSGAAFAAQNTLNVKCVDASGKALAGTKVFIMALQDPKYRDGKGEIKWANKSADGSGVAKFDKLDDGVYRIVARPEGLAPGLYELLQLRNGVQETITIQCAAGDPAKQFYFDSGSQLNNQARASMDLAMGAFQKSDFAGAEKNLRDALDANPSLPDTLYYTAVALIQQKKWDEAKVILEKATVNVDALVSLPPPKDAKGQIMPSPYAGIQQLIHNLLPQMPSLKLRVEGNEAMVAKDYKLAATRFADAAKIVPNDPDTHYNLALALGQDKQYQEALAAIDKAIALKPEDKAYLDLKQRLVANQSMSKARDILIEGDTLYNEKKDYPAALKKYEEALPMLTDPVAQALVYDQIGKAYTTMRQSEPAVSAFNKAIELDPEKKQYKDDLVGHYRVMAQYYFTEKQYDKAFDFFKQAGQSPYQIGQSSAAKGDNDLALMAFERSLKDDPQNAEAYFELGTLYYYNKKDSARAKEMFVKYMEVGKDEKRISQAKDLLTVIDRKK